MTPPSRSGRLAAWVSTLSGRRADLTALLAGALAALALPPVNAIPVLLLSVPALLCLIQGARGAATAARRGWWFGLGLNIAGLYWITEAILIEADQFWWLVPFAVPALAAVLALFVAAAATVTSYARPGWPMALTLAGAWVLTDLARQFVLTGFPWNPLGSVWALPGAVGDVLIQPAALVGVHGLTCLTLLLAATPLLGWRPRIAAISLLAAWCAFGVARLAQPIPPGPDVTVLLVQGNVAQGEKWNRAIMVAIFRRYLDMTRDAIAGVHGPAVIVWPETASPALLQTDDEARVLIAQAAGGNQALIGGVRFDQDGRPRNSLFALGPGGRIEAIYDKAHLVPFGEYQPDWLPLGIQLVPGGGFARGPGPQTLVLPGLPPVGPLICYEAIFSRQVVDPDHRPDWMVNVTNDAWFGNSSGPRQHLVAARLRAVEEGLPLFRAANTGISAAFDARGHELARLGMRQTGVVSAHLPGNVPPPVYTRVGLAAPLAMGVMAVLFGLLGRRRNSKTGNPSKT